MAELLSVPLKKPSEVDLVKPLKNLIQSRYSTADKPEDYSDAINELSKQRNTAIWKVFEKYESSLEIIYGYYDQIVALESKIPAQELQVPFKWKDAFDKGSIFGSRISLTVSSLSYEKVCVLFNIAALQSAVAAQQSIENDDGLKLAVKLLQLSSGIFQHLKNHVMLLIQQDPTPDLNPDTLGALSSLMLAQAQEMFVHKAIHDNMKDSIVAKLASACEDLYAECLKTFQRENLKSIWEKDWVPMIAGKQAGFSAIAEFYQSLICKNEKLIGEEISRLTRSVELFKAAQQRSGRPNLFEELCDKAERNLTSAKKDNDFIYHERIPDIKSVEPIGKAQPAKALPVPHPMSQGFRDLFSELVPVGVHQALAAYDVRKTEIVNTEITRLRESTQELNGLLASMNLPAAIEVTDSASGLPPSILEKANMVSQLGGINELQRISSELPDLLKRNQDILDETDRMLNEEKQADDSLRQQFKAQWTRTPSEKLTDMFRNNIAKYRQIINNAVEADKVVRQKFESNRNGIQILSKPPAEIEAALPHGPSGNVENSSAVVALRQLMEEVETIKAERDVIESELKSATTDMKDVFLTALAKDGAISEAPISVETLGRVYGPLQKQVAESIEKQASLISRIREAHAQFTQESGSTAGGRETMMCELAAAHDAFRDLLNNLKEGTKFYNDLTQLLVTFQNKVSDFTFARKTEKEELLKDLTQQTSRAGPAPTPTQPSYHSGSQDGQPSTPSVPSSAPSPATTTSGSLPYPVYVQGMPVPYGASGSAPYPSYVPPPMPQGYNPYGTMPYPSTYQYPGGFPQNPGQFPQGYQQPPPGSYPPQQGHPNYPPQNPW
ncbi:programmed cell death 6-interacting protein isoform X2 [Aethina tumida]|uniref:programmed cell death 6-interacting protein isoform X2 n=1 Tax=Aethina tumida TaxID=116153 RepID=UPI0021485A1F|nr:programmed cell death 6-interacting protein isoform X2 [Aethina tumida]